MGNTQTIYPPPDMYIKNVLDIGSLWGKAGVNLFSLIMGYYCIFSEELFFKKLIKLESTILQYTLGGLIFALLMRMHLSAGNIIISIFPVIFEHYWFITAYFIVYILAPYINKCLKVLSQENYVKLLGVLMLFGSIIPFFTGRQTSGLFWNQLNWFIIMYIMGSYLRIYKPAYRKQVYVWTLVVCNVLLICSVLIISKIANYIPVLSDYTVYFRWSNSPLVIVICLCLMRIAEQTPVWNNNYINKFATLVIGIYLFQENVFFRDYLWGQLFINTSTSNSLFLIIHYSISVFLVCMLGAIVEYIRSYLVHSLSRLSRCDHCKQ